MTRVEKVDPLDDSSMRSGKKRMEESVISRHARIRERGLNSDWNRFPAGRNILEELPDAAADYIFNNTLVHPKGDGFPSQEELIDKLEHNKYPAHLGGIDSVDPIVDFINEYKIVGGGEEM